MRSGDPWKRRPHERRRVGSLADELGQRGGPLPDIRARAVHQVSRHRRANLIFLALMASGALANAWEAIAGRAEPGSAWSLILWSAALSIGFMWIQRGSRLRRTASPREALAFLEQRVRVERQGAQIVRWGYSACLLFVAIYYRGLFGDAWLAKLVARLIFLAFFVIAFTAPWWIRRFTARQQAEIDVWRRWMDEQQL
jgi:hypothetical protein